MKATERTQKTCFFAKRSQIENLRMNGDVSRHQHFIKMTGLLQMASFFPICVIERALPRRLLGWLSVRTVAVVDNIAHGLTGAVIGYCGFRQRGGSDAGRAALWTCVAAAEFPDIDVVLGFWGRDTFFRFHRSFTHSAVMRN